MLGLPPHSYVEGKGDDPSLCKPFQHGYFGDSRFGSVSCYVNSRKGLLKMIIKVIDQNLSQELYRNASPT